MDIEENDYQELLEDLINNSDKSEEELSDSNSLQKMNVYRSESPYVKSTPSPKDYH
jgi:hypothetical protein